MSTYKDLEKELCGKMDEILDPDGEMDFTGLLMSISDKEAIEEMEHDDLVLGLSGVDKDALNRVERRREYIKRLKQIEEKSRKDKEESLKKWIERQEAKNQDAIKDMLIPYGEKI